MTGFPHGRVLAVRDFYITAGTGAEEVKALVVIIGQDIAAVFGGGEQPHIGASALAVPRPSLAAKENISASASVICVTGHKEDQLARTAALRLSAKFSCVVNVTVGLHIDQAADGEINRLVSNFHDCLASVETLLEKQLEN